MPYSVIRSFVLLGFLAVGIASAPGHPRPSGDPPADEAPEPTEAYEVRRVEGWDVLVNRRFLDEQPALAGSALELLRHQLYQVARRVPANALDRLRQVRIWVEEREGHHPCMAYHPSPDWLSEHGMNPEKARCVEVADARNFLAWSRDQPWMVLHELAHGFHHQFLDNGFENREVRTAYAEAMAAGRYESVLRINGRDDRAYATTDPMEYFAEATEAFFGTNDFFPYVRSELSRHDPKGYELMERVWGAR